MAQTTRSVLSSAGRDLAKNVRIGTNIAVELESEAEPYLVGRVVAPPVERQLEEVHTRRCGINDGDCRGLLTEQRTINDTFRCDDCECALPLGAKLMHCSRCEDWDLCFDCFYKGDARPFLPHPVCLNETEEHSEAKVACAGTLLKVRAPDNSFVCDVCQAKVKKSSMIMHCGDCEEWDMCIACFEKESLQRKYKSTSCIYRINKEEDTPWMGLMKSGDLVINVQKFDPLQPGSSTFVLNNTAVFPVFIDDIRVIKLKLTQVKKPKGRAGVDWDSTGGQRFKLSATEKGRILD